MWACCDNGEGEVSCADGEGPAQSADQEGEEGEEGVDPPGSFKSQQIVWENITETFLQEGGDTGEVGGEEDLDQLARQIEATNAEEKETRGRKKSA